MKSMKITTTVSNFREAIKFPMAVSQKKATIPILSAVLIDGATMELIGSALDKFAISKLRGKCKNPKRVAFLVAPVRKWLATDFDTEDLIIEQTDAGVRFTSGNFKMTVSSFDGKSFPSIPQPDEEGKENLSPNFLLAAIKAANPFMSTELSRYTLNSFLLKFESDIATVVATDGHKLYQCRKRCTEQFKSSSKNLIPSDIVPVLSDAIASAKELTVQRNKSGDHFFFETPEVRLVTRLAQGRFPNYEALWRGDHKVTATVTAATFLQVLKRIAIGADERSRTITLSLQDNVRVSSSNENSKMEEDMAAEIFGKPGLRIGFNVEYLGALVRSMKSDRVKLSFLDAESAVDVTPEKQDEDFEQRALLMPMRI